MLSRAPAQKPKRIFRHASPIARRHATFAAGAHILSETPNAKEDAAMNVQMPNIGDVDDLIFQDHWLVSDR